MLITKREDGIHRTTFQPSSKYCLHFRFYLTTKLPVTQVDSTELPVSFFDQTPSDSRFCPLESCREYWTCVERTRGFKNALCHSRSVLVSAHCFKNELCFLCSVLVLTHRFKNDLCVPTSVLVSTHGEFCCLLGQDGRLFEVGSYSINQSINFI